MIRYVFSLQLAMSPFKVKLHDLFFCQKDTYNLIERHSLCDLTVVNTQVLEAVN